MLGCVIHGRGDLRVDELPEPAAGPGQALVAVRYGGVCGSDLHYWRHGGVGDFRLREPMVLGHEVVGTVLSYGPGAAGPAPGTAVAVHPATPCGVCPECADGRANVCRDTRYLGSAARMPHVQGGFAARVVVPAAQVRALPEGLDLRRAALAEPLSVALHAVRRAGPVAGRPVLVTGAGPIGCLVVAAAKAAGAGRVTVTDLLPRALSYAAGVGADDVVRADDPADAGWPDSVDVAVEASGVAAGLDTCLRLVRRGGVVVQLGMLPPGQTPFAGNLVVSREIELRGAFRFADEFDEALTLLAREPAFDSLISAVVPLEEAESAFALAADRGEACKVLLDFGV
ncbi:L-idonate 5-dehydrogenase [Streptomyces avermitilis]|uniref:L-idonate 5-dehydrogenase n=2 Tax=Streptomyces avermitilis TaxID=33903 RepID=Q828N6_STRAW|nr:MULTISPECIES: L-idonate 5-dehydrogenase [Streptomyces]KUN53821.1 L-idonate 5-dehydrogenase [Streptomyces avermitilis]MYT02168.1 alcohol dehydrogenase catalytic domain-containing protein [Streptomyces sp. SID5469]OOV27188.1 L-idonate 5-dehydrogenase [Streptomyces avermitilis]BAC74337.1 putative L-idonate 5-dehydrogenase [Streptomyces avermitilis MA-4680 = NBRC 14893]BBJ54892.1 L-idonate 5-dehydrogenase [Streptomyces avermitilis]